MEPTKKLQEKEGSSREKVYLIIIILLVLGYVPMVWQLVDRGQEVQVLADDNTALEIEKNTINLELETLKYDFNSLQTNNTEMQTRIDSQRVKIEALQLELETASGDKAHLRRVIAKLKKETETLRTIMKGFVVTIDSLNTLNQNLTAELGDTRERLTDANANIERVSSERDDLAGQVEVASVLETQNMSSGAIRVRGSGSQKSTNRAKNADMVKTCFDVRENKLASPGDKTYYVRVITPDGSVMRPAVGETHFEWKGGSGNYTVKHTEKYANSLMNVCIYFDIESDEVPSGKYLTEVYENGHRIGKTYFELK